MCVPALVTLQVCNSSISALENEYGMISDATAIRSLPSTFTNASSKVPFASKQSHIEETRGRQLYKCSISDCMTASRSVGSHVELVSLCEEHVTQRGSLKRANHGTFCIIKQQRRHRTPFTYMLAQVHRARAT
jgi:hypothetical protein